MSHNIFVLNFWSIVDKKALPVSGATMGTGLTDLIILRVKVTRVSPLAVQERGPSTHIIDVAMNYRDNLR